MTDIIQDAKRLLDGATPGPWITGGKDESGNIYIGNPSEYGNLVATSGICDADLIAAAPELTETIAGMEWEYQCQRLLAGAPDDWYTWLTTGSLESAKRHTEKHAAKMRARGYDLPSYRIRRRLVGDWEVINE